MKNLIQLLTLLFLLTSTLQASNTKIKYSYAIGIFNEQGNGENIQHVRKTKNDYNGTCYSKIVVIGKLNKSIPNVSIGKSRGKLVKSISIYNRFKIKIGEEITFKHLGITNGYFKVSINNKLYDTKVFIK